MLGCSWILSFYQVYLKKTNRSKSSGSDAGEPIAGAPTSEAPTPYEPFDEQFGSPPTPAAYGGDADERDSRNQNGGN